MPPKGFGDLFTEFLRFINEGPDTDRVFEIETQGANGETLKIYVGNRSPVGAVTADPGSLYIRVSGTTSGLFQHLGAGSDNTSWTPIPVGDFLRLDGSSVMTGNLDMGGFDIDNAGLVGGVGTSAQVRNESGATILKGKLVYVAGFSVPNLRPLVDLADRTDAAKRPAIGFASADILNNANGSTIIVGTLKGVDTSMFALTDQLVLGTAGNVDRPPPDTTPFGGEVQNVGSVSRVHATDGEIVVSIDGLEAADIRQATTLIYRPGEATANLNPSLFSDFNELYETFQVMEGPVIIWFDDAITSPVPIPAKSGGGAYDFEQRAAFASVAGPGVIASAQDDCEIIGVPRISGLHLRSDNTTTPVITASGTGLILENTATLSVGAAVATKPVLRVPTATSFTIVARHSTILEDGVNGNPVIDLVGTGNLTIIGFSGANVANNTIDGPVGSFLTLLTSSTGAALSATQAGMLGALTAAFGTNAARLGYTPTTPADWSPTPDDAKEALDQLAGRGADAAPTNVSKSAAVVGVSLDWAHEDHKHDIDTAAPTATGVATASAEGVATTAARSDHAHQANTTPVNVTKAAAAIGTSGEPARADHKHDVTTAAPSALTHATNASAEGSAASLARSDHAHANPLPTSYLTGLATSRNTGTPASQVDIAVGRCRDDADSFNILTSGTLTADITAAGANGLDTGAEAADTWYSIWVIADSTAVNVPAALLSISATAPTMPAGYDKKRRVGWVRNDAGSNFRPFVVRDRGRDRWVLYEEEAAANLTALSAGSALAFTDVDISAYVPPSQRHALFNLSLVAAGTITPPGFARFRVNGSAQTDPIFFARLESTDGSDTQQMQMPVDASRIFEYIVTDAEIDVTIVVMGYLDSLE